MNEVNQQAVENPQWDERRLIELSQTDPVVYSWYRVWINRQCTKEQMLVAMVLALAEQNKVLMETAIEKAQRQVLTKEFLK